MKPHDDLDAARGILAGLCLAVLLLLGMAGLIYLGVVLAKGGYL